MKGSASEKYAGGASFSPLILPEYLLLASNVLPNSGLNVKKNNCIFAGNPEIVIHGETGLLVPPANAQALVDATLSLLEDEEAASRYGSAGRKRVEDNFGLGKMIREYEDLFVRVLSTERS